MTVSIDKLPTIFDGRISKAFQEKNGFELQPNILMACYVGSISFGTNIGSVLDDVDMMCIVMPPERCLFGLDEWTHWHYQEDELDIVFYSLKKYVGLLEKSNPNVIGTLWMKPEMFMVKHPLWTKWIESYRSIYSTQKAYEAFGGYAYSQLSRLNRGVYNGYMGEERKKLVDKYGYDIKNASHLIRLYRMGTEFMETGILNVYREDRAELIEIKKGLWTLNQVLQEAENLRRRLEDAKINSTLPLEPNRVSINMTLMALHREFLQLN